MTAKQKLQPKSQNGLSSTTFRWFKVSWVSLLASVIPIAIVPIIIWLTDDRYPGWDQLSEQLTILSYGLLIAVLLLLVSFSAGIAALRSHRIVLLWVIPIGGALLVGIVLLIGLALSMAGVRINF